MIIKNQRFIIQNSPKANAICKANCFKRLEEAVDGVNLAIKFEIAPELRKNSAEKYLNCTSCGKVFNLASKFSSPNEPGSEKSIVKENEKKRRTLPYYLLEMFSFKCIIKKILLKKNNIIIDSFLTKAENFK